MADSVFEIMKASAAASIPHYQEQLTSMDPNALQGVLSVLGGQALSPATGCFLTSLGAGDTASYQRLSELESQELVQLDECLQQCWSQFRDDAQQRALRKLYQLISAHFFVYHLEAINHDPAA